MTDSEGEAPTFVPLSGNIGEWATTPTTGSWRSLIASVNFWKATGVALNHELVTLRYDSALAPEMQCKLTLNAQA